MFFKQDNLVEDIDIKVAKITPADIKAEDIALVRDNLDDPSRLIALAKKMAGGLARVEYAENLALMVAYAASLGNLATVKKLWDAFVNSNFRNSVNGDLKIFLKLLTADDDIMDALDRAKQAATVLSAGEAEQKLLKGFADKANTVQISVDNSGNMPYYRIVTYDPRYGKGAGQYIIFGKKISAGNYKMSIEGSPRKKTNFAEPAFETAQQAIDFIKNACGNMQTIKPIGDFVFSVTNKPFALARLPKDPANYNGYPRWQDFEDLSHYKLVDSDCGPCYIHKASNLAASYKKTGKYNFTDALVEDTEAMPSANAVAKHTTLNPKLWTADEVLKPEVEEKIKQIVDVFLAGLAEDEIKINVRDILIIGSNASYNYTPYSDLDLHIIVDTDSLECPDNLYSKLYSAYRSLFNKRLDIDFYNIPVEIYVEDESTPRVSNGVYSVLNREWLQEPKYVNIPDMDMDVFNAELAKWEERYRQVLNDAVGELEEYYEPDPDAAEDIKTQQIKEIDDYIEDLYNLRKIGLPLTGEYGLENVIFKTIRNKGYLDRLKDLKNELLGKELSLSEMVDQLSNNEPEELPEGLGMLSNKQITEYRIKIAQLAHTQPLINPYGKFTISNVSENDADYICRILKAQDYIESVNKTPGRFDFKGMATTGMPKRMYNISGQIKI